MLTIGYPSPVFHVLPPSPVDDTPGISKLSVGALRNKDQRIGLDKCSRLATCGLNQSQYLTQLWHLQGQISEKSTFFSTSRGDSDAAMADIAMKHPT